METVTRPRIVIALAALFLVSALLTLYAGLSARGYLIPAGVLALESVLLWFGRFRPLFSGLLILSVLSGLVMVLVLAFGDGLGHMKLNISGVALVINVLTGGPLMSVIGGPILSAMRHGTVLPGWFSAARTS